jgi:hypothetical protein
MNPSLEGLEQLALRVRSGEPALGRDALSAGYSRALSHDRALATLMAEAWVVARCEPALDALDRAWVDAPVALANEPPVALDALPSAVALEAGDARRAALWDLACTRANERFSLGRAAVAALRTTAGDLAISPAESLVDHVGLGGIPGCADAALAATEGVFDELDPWALREAGLHEQVGAARHRALPFSARLRSLAAPRASGQVPLGDRGGASARWMDRIGLGSARDAIVDRMGTAEVRAPGVSLRCDREGERAVLSGACDPSVHGGTLLSAAWAEALACTLPAREPRPALRAGVDRVHRLALSWLGAHLWLSPAWLSRELGVDPARASLVGRAALHGALVRLRMAAAEAPFARDALEGRPELTARLRERSLRALGSSPEPSWTVHLAARAMSRRAEATVMGALVEAALFEDLRSACDEDWFRNPRAGVFLLHAADALRTQGAVRWLRVRTGVGEQEPDALALSRAATLLAGRTREAFERLTR